MNTDVKPAESGTILEIWEKRWGLPILSAGARYFPGDAEGLELRGPDDRLLGLVTWAQVGEFAEIVTLDILDQGQGHGKTLLAAAEKMLGDKGIKKLRLITTNDNIKAVALYQKCGYRLTAIYLDAMDEVRRIKHTVPTVGENGIPLLDMWEFTKEVQ